MQGWVYWVWLMRLLRVLKADGFQVKIQPGALKSLAESRVGLVQVFAHAGVLAALAGV